jgi:hypothetical protein
MVWILQIDASSRRQKMPEMHQGNVKTELVLGLALNEGILKELTVFLMH